MALLGMEANAEAEYKVTFTATWRCLINVYTRSEAARVRTANAQILTKSTVSTFPAKLGSQISSKLAADIIDIASHSQLAEVD